MADGSDLFASFPVLETERFILREVTPDDTAAFFHIFSDPEVNRYLGRHPLKSIEEAAKRTEIYRSQFLEQMGIVWAITDHAQGQVIGNFLIWNWVKPHFRAEIGYSLAPEWWGKGVTTEVARVGITFAFDRMGLHRLAAEIDPENAASRRVLEKLGFEQEAYFHEDFFHPVKQQFTDSAIYGLLKSTWRSRMNR
jgi:[ribosomal protein S5]-alanine N-acetyltransferase